MRYCVIVYKSTIRNGCTNIALVIAKYKVSPSIDPDDKRIVKFIKRWENIKPGKPFRTILKEAKRRAKELNSYDPKKP